MGSLSDWIAEHLVGEILTRKDGPLSFAVAFGPGEPLEGAPDPLPSPCPFCGNAAVMLVREARDEGQDHCTATVALRDEWLWHCECSQCGAASAKVPSMRGAMRVWADAAQVVGKLGLIGQVSHE